jgi:DNA repair protein RecN (Recombination protein N)
LSDENVQFDIIDAIADNPANIQQYQALLKSYADKTKLNLVKKQGEALKEQEYHSFLLNELVEANLKSGEQQVLEDDFEKLNNVESIKDLINHWLPMKNKLFYIIKEIKVSLQKIAAFQ